MTQKHRQQVLETLPRQIRAGRWLDWGTTETSQRLLVQRKQQVVVVEELAAGRLGEAVAGEAAVEEAAVEEAVAEEVRRRPHGMR